MPPPVCRVLVVDDDRDNADSLTALIRYRGHFVETAYEGALAVEIASWFHPDVVFLDLEMPLVNGYEVLTKIRTQQKRNPPFFVAYTGYVTPREIERCRGEGFNIFLAKPMVPEDLAAILSGVSGARPA